MYVRRRCFSIGPYFRPVCCRSGVPRRRERGQRGGQEAPPLLRPGLRAELLGEDAHDDGLPARSGGHAAPLPQDLRLSGRDGGGDRRQIGSQVRRDFENLGSFRSANPPVTNLSSFVFN
jgi:hypothetical protein